MKIVGIGASAGGMEALIEFLKYLPKDTGAAFVLIQHLSPDHKSIMDEILGKHTQMPIVPVDKNTTPLADHIYINVPQKNITYQYGMLIAHERDKSKRINLPIDDFFHSLGNALKKDAIAVIFSGSGTDGSRGCRTVKEKGGLILVQDIGSAGFDGMPKAVINMEIADMVGTPEELSTTLIDVLKRKVSLTKAQEETDINQSQDYDSISKVVDYVSSELNVDFSSYKEPTLVRRMKNRMLLQRINAVEEYHDYLQEHKEEVKALGRDFFIGVTAFFRDGSAFEELEQHIIPKIANTDAENTVLRLWIPACSTGEEAYSIAILLDNYIKKNKLTIDYKIFASDINPRAIRIASNGIYPCNLVADVPDRLLSRYFQSKNENYVVKSEIRDKILFAVHNVLSDPPFIRMDLISCRNFLIYLKTDTQKKLLTTLHFALNSKGFLFLGPSETLGELSNVFVKVISKWNIFRRKENTHLLPNRTTRIDTPEIPKVRNIEELEADMPDFSEFLEDEVDSFSSYLVRYFAPFCIFFNEQLDVLFTNVDAEIFDALIIDGGDAGIKLHPRQQEIFEEGLKKVQETGEPYAYEDLDSITIHEQEAYEVASLVFRTVEAKAQKEKVFLAEIQVNEDSRPGQIPVYKELQKQKLFDEQRRRMKEQIEQSENRTQNLIDEQRNINEELQQSNRELMASNEELQSTNEELQSVNEELFTVNNELQQKNQELTVANDDINNILRSTEIGIIFLDEDLRIRKFTPVVQEEFSLKEHDIGRLITNFSHSFIDLNLEEVCRTVQQSSTEHEEEVQDSNGNYFLLRILPYKTVKKTTNDLVIYFLDISELVEIRQTIESLTQKYLAIFKNTEDVIIEVLEDGTICDLNKSWGGYKAEALKGQSIFDLVSNPDGLQTALKKATYSNDAREVKGIVINTFHYNLYVLPTHTHQAFSNHTSASTLIIAEDVTEVRGTVAKLEAAVQEYKAFLDATPFQIMLVERSGNIAYLNRTIYSSKPKEDFVHTNVVDYVNEEEGQQYLEALESIFTGKPFQQLSVSYPLNENKNRKIELIITPVIIGEAVQLAAVMSKDVLAK